MTNVIVAFATEEQCARCAMALEAGGIAYSGYTYRYVTEIRGHKIGFGGCRETVWRQKPEIMREDLQALREEGCEVIVYSCHWGKEYAARHNERQEKMAREAIDGGADLVIGRFWRVAGTRKALQGHIRRDPSSCGAGRRRAGRRGDCL